MGSNHLEPYEIPAKIDPRPTSEIIARLQEGVARDDLREAIMRIAIDWIATEKIEALSDTELPSLVDALADFVEAFHSEVVKRDRLIQRARVRALELAEGLE